MARTAQWWSRQIAAMPEFGTAKMAGLVAAGLFALCGLLVADLGVLVPDGPQVHKRLVVLTGLMAIACGLVVAALPWQRWRRSMTLVLVPRALALIAVHNYATGADGLRYNIFFFVVFVWLGLMHPSGTALKFAPLMAAAYLAPCLWLHDVAGVATGLTYSLPVCVLIGECVSLVAARLRYSEAQVRRSEQRLRALVHHSTDAISIIDASGVITWESPSITNVLGYEPTERVGRLSADFVHASNLALMNETLDVLSSVPDAEAIAEVQARHKDGSWRWIEARARNVLQEDAVGGIVVSFSDVTKRHRDEALRRQLAAIVESSSDAIIAQTPDGVVLSWNSAAEAMYGYTAGEMIGTSILRIVPLERVDELGQMLQTVGNGVDLSAVETQRVRRDGTLVDVSLSLSGVRDSSGRVVALASIARDITDEVAARRALADREESFRLLFAANPQPMWVYDVTSMLFLEVNDAAVRHYGYDRDVFLAMPVTSLGPLTEGPARHVLADGRMIDVEVTSHRLEFAGHDAVLVAVQDVTERNALDAQLRHQAFHDSLTGLSNRALFGDRVQHALGRRTGRDHPILLLLDLDRFKLVNDSLGHAVGDELLIEVARRLETSVRLGDTVARLGGDEFAILLEDCEIAGAERQASRVLNALATPTWINGHQVFATASIGIAVADSTSSAGDLLRNADVAMYRAKAAGGGRFQMFQPAMVEAAARQMELTAAMRRALDRGEFVLHYQPIVDVVTGKVTSMEALARWRHPELGLLRPKEFIPLAEDSGLIVALGSWVLHEACREAAAWPDGTALNVNLSGVQLEDSSVVDDVSRALRESGLDPSRLTLEITESVVLQHSDTNMRRLRRLRDLGVTLAIDDFGTGYSSLSYLRAFPVHELKIDRSFVAAMGGDADSLALVRTIVQLAGSLSLGVVAEGVETAAQYDALRAIGCDKIQGFYVSRPVPADDAVAVVAGGRPWHVVSMPAQRSSFASMESVDLVEGG